MKLITALFIGAVFSIPINFYLEIRRREKIVNDIIEIDKKINYAKRLLRENK